MIDLLRLLPRFWYQASPTSESWDAALNRALDKHGVTEVSPHYAQVGPFKVWISNYPYAFGQNDDDGLELLPRCWTRMRLRKAIMQWHADRCNWMIDE